jgi:formate hydrogenlyase transcriptional activator
MGQTETRELEPNQRVAHETAETIFEKLFEFSPDAIVSSDDQGRITRVNAQLERMFGYSREELLGRPIEVLVPERARGVHAAHRERYHADPRVRLMGAGLDLYARRKDGTEFPVDIMLSPVASGSGQQVLSVIRDITERKQAELALRRSEERFRLLLENVKDYAIFMLDAEGRVTSWNAGAERIKGYLAEEIIGQHFSRFYTAEDVARGKPEAELRAAALQGRFEDEGWRVRKDGSRFWANVVVTALFDESGAVRGFAKVTRDFTERKRAEEALLLEVTSALISNVDIRGLFAAISAGIGQLLSHDYASLALYDPAIKKLRLHVLTAPSGLGPIEEETLAPLDDSPGGWVYSRREPVILDPTPKEPLSQPSLQRWRAAGIRAACWLPMVNQGRALGVLTVARLQENAFADKEVFLLSQLASQAAAALDNALAFRKVSELKERLEEEKLYLQDELRTEYNFDEIVGESPSLKRVLKQVETVAPTNATVLILGETGTGKELVARAIHNLSSRRERTFVKLNCAAIPSGLLESELFGHERGAFTGAITQKIGRLELADQGTLFLDEVGDIPLELQPKLLRALQEKEFERLGSTRTIPVDVRLIAATNRDLAQMVKQRQFRSDLYYRLRVFPINVPPLREREEDIPLLVHHCVQKHARRMNKKIEIVPREVMRAFEQWQWPGNVRELENLIERAVILSRGTVLRVPLSELSLPDAAEAAPNAAATLETAEREHILRVLREARGVIAGPNGAAARLGLKRTTLNFKMKKLGITRADL